MRRFSAHYVFTAAGRPLKYGIVETNDAGIIQKVTDTGGVMREVRNLEFYPGVLVPGFINAHCHLELSHLAGRIAEKSELAAFIGGVVDERKAHPDLVEKAALNADAEMYRAGITAVGDVCNAPDTIAIKQLSKIRYHNFIEFFGLLTVDAEQRHDTALRLREHFRHEKLRASLSPHAAYSVSEALWNAVKPDLNAEKVITVHHAESKQEKELLQHKTGLLADRFKRLGYRLEALPQHAASMQSLLDLYAPNPRRLWVHNTLAESHELPKPGKNQDYLVLCPCSNLYIESRLPDIPALMKSGLPICLGTDSLASNRRLSILNEMLTIQNHYPDIPLEELIQWSTIHGARALGMDDELGSMEEGKKPGILHLSAMDTIHMKLREQTSLTRLI